MPRESYWKREMIAVYSRWGDELFYAGTSNISGGLSEVQLVDERFVGRKLKNIGFPEAAALSLIASRPESKKCALDHGADHVINHHEPLEEQLEALGIHGVHYIFCLTNVDDHMKNLAKTILPAFKPLHLDLFSKSVTFSDELMYTGSVFQTEDMASQHAILMRLADWVEEGNVRSP